MKKILKLAILNVALISLNSLADTPLAQPLAPTFNELTANQNACINASQTFSTNLTNYYSQLSWSQRKPFMHYQQFFLNFALNGNYWNQSCSNGSCTANTGLDCYDMFHAHPHDPNNQVQTVIKNYLQNHLAYYTNDQIGSVPNQYTEVTCSFSSNNPNVMQCQAAP